MAGLIESAKDSGATPKVGAAGDLAPNPAGDGGSLTPQAVRAKMKIPGNLQDAYQRIVLAGRKIMYSPDMGEQIAQLLKQPGPVGAKLGQGVFVLLGLLLDKSNNTIPPQLIIPAAVELVTEAGDFLRKAGVKVSDSDIAEGVAAVVAQVLQKAGVSMDQLPQLLGKQQEAPADTAEDAADGGADEEQEQT